MLSTHECIHSPCQKISLKALIIITNYSSDSLLPSQKLKTFLREVYSQSLLQFSYKSTLSIHANLFIMQPDYTSTLTIMDLCKASLFDKDIKGNRGSDCNIITTCFVFTCFWIHGEGLWLVLKSQHCSKEGIIFFIYYIYIF